MKFPYVKIYDFVTMTEGINVRSETEFENLSFTEAVSSTYKFFFFF